MCPTKPVGVIEPAARPGYFKTEIVWRNVIFFIVLHLAVLYTVIGCVHLWTWKLFLAFQVSAYLAAYSISIGAHRLWSHKCFKAKLPLRIVLMLLNCMAGQNDIYEWSRDHR